MTKTILKAGAFLEIHDMNPHFLGQCLQHSPDCFRKKTL